jgi:DNA-binding NarL/FixJ family response regulator
LHAPEREQNVNFEELSPFQRQLAMAVGEGLDVAQLSVRFSRSTYTIERQLEQVLQRTGVTSAGELRARIRERRAASNHKSGENT